MLSNVFFRGKKPYFMRVLEVFGICGCGRFFRLRRNFSEADGCFLGKSWENHPCGIHRCACREKRDIYGKNNNRGKDGGIQALAGKGAGE
jgi:hypothetical protein